MHSKYFLKTYWFYLACFFATVSVQQNVFAQNKENESDNHERWYQVEIIVFSRNENNAREETWPKNIKLFYPDNIIALKPVDTNNPEGFNLLKPNERQLNTQAGTIAKSGSYTLLFHQAWRQMIYAKKTSILITGGKTFNGHQELEGSIDLSVAQFLKIQTNLWLTQFASAQSMVGSSSTNDTTDAWPELPALPNSDLASEQTQDYKVKRIVKVSQQRSMRSVEIHYIDHPLLGIILKIVPYDAPSL